MGQLTMDLPKYIKELKELLELMKSNDLAEVELEEEGQKIRLRKTEPHISAAPVAIQGGIPAALPTGNVPEAGTEEPVEVEDDLHKVDSPLVGTFYKSAKPDTPHFISEGAYIKEGQIICIIEAMKIFNEIESEYSGTVLRILVKDATPVEYGQDLFIISTE